MLFCVALLNLYLWYFEIGPTTLAECLIQSALHIVKTIFRGICEEKIPMRLRWSVSPKYSLYGDVHYREYSLHGQLTVYSFFAVHSTFYSTDYVVQQISQLGLLVSLAFLGDNLHDTISYLENHSQSISNGQKSYLLYHYAPSRLSTKYDLTNVKFEPCQEDFRDPVFGQVADVGNSDCLYSLNRFAKVGLID